jgi:hypothetical protein
VIKRDCTKNLSINPIIKPKTRLIRHANPRYEQYRVEISNRFAALENLDTEVDINRAWETIRENITFSAKGSPGYYELK